MLEHFKHHFAQAAGTTSSYSSSASWAESDLRSYMNEAAANAPLFIEAFYNACGALAQKGLAVPDVARINRILAENDAGYQIDPPNLVSTGQEIGHVDVPAPVTSLDEEAQELIQNSLSQSEQFLAEGKNRAAVQEILWLLETVSTSFQGLDTGAGTVQGKYFNKIVSDLSHQRRDTTLKHVLDWIMSLHGYLSSPTGGGIRHGADIRGRAEVQRHEARLFCNLIRSYVRFLIDEHERLAGRKVLDV